MKNRLLLTAAMVAAAPLATLIKGWGAPPSEGMLFGSVELGLGLILCLVFYRGWRSGDGRSNLTSQILWLAGVGGCCLLVYVVLYFHCVKSHPDYEQLLYYPLWTTGKAAEMVARAGGREQAFARYGFAAIAAAILEMPSWIPLATTVGLLLLHGTAILLLSSAFILASFTLDVVLPGEEESHAVPEATPHDVFVCHNAKDKLSARQFARRLEKRNLSVWVDADCLPIGQSWLAYLQAQLSVCRAFVVLIGEHGLGQWQMKEVEATLHENVRRKCPVVPVLLAERPTNLDIPVFLQALTWIDIAQEGEAGFEKLVTVIRQAPPTVPHS